jgi:phosphoribosylamine---glycine ligase
MKILVVGSGGREHALCWAFGRSGKVNKIFCANGNAGIAEIAECIDIGPDDISALAEFASAKKIDLTFVGGETSLALGIVDEFESRGLRIVGATGTAARLESSKAFAKHFMARHNIPTAGYDAAGSIDEAIEILESGAFGDAATPVVVKADGLAAGKGVVVARDRAEAVAAINDMEGLTGAAAASTIVLEECLTGREVSLIMFVDGKSFSLMPPTRDHKRIGENDTGPNTGGMGTITGSALLSEAQTSEIIETVVKPTLKGCRDEGFPFKGILFLGLMMTQAGPKVLEYNVRFGDPETQVILIRLETDIVDICEAMIEGRLADLQIDWKEENSACVVLAAEGYPQSPRKGDVIHGLEGSGDRDTVVFHAGTARNAEGDLITAGGRVLGVTSCAGNLQDALEKAYKTVERISWQGMQYRRDIGK